MHATSIKIENDRVSNQELDGRFVVQGPSSQLQVLSYQLQLQLRAPSFAFPAPSPILPITLPQLPSVHGSLTVAVFVARPAPHGVLTGCLLPGLSVFVQGAITSRLSPLPATGLLFIRASPAPLPPPPRRSAVTPLLPGPISSASFFHPPLPLARMRQ